MRKIEEKMLWAVRSRRNMQEGNTQVVICSGAKNGGIMVNVFLHGNHIYTLYALNGTVSESFTLAGWNTPTTRSRLRALGIDVSQKNWEAYYNWQAISSSEWYEVIR